MRLLKLGLLTILVMLTAQIASAETTRDQKLHKIRQKMDIAYLALEKLQPYLYSEEEFASDQNSQLISEQLKILKSSFNQVSDLKSSLSSQPGFNTTLSILNDMLDDSSYRFDEGRKSYAQWRLRTVSSYCVSCHSREQEAREFFGNAPNIDKLAQIEKGEFYFATRQFSKAEVAFVKAARWEKQESRRMSALRKWLVLKTRIRPNPSQAAADLARLLPKTKLSASDYDEVNSWLHSLRRWANESKTEKAESLGKAEELVRIGRGSHEPLAARRLAVELLRATSILHNHLESGKTQHRPKVLFLLALSYSELPFFFAEELPELFLEQCIREHPNSNDARSAYRLYEELVVRGYTGSGGTHLPSDIKLDLDELRDLAYGSKKIPTTG